MILHYKQLDSDQTQIFNAISRVIRIGRSPGPNTLCLVGDGHISRKHAELGFKDGRYWIEDLNSRSGTFINNEQLLPGQKLLIKPGDQIRIGMYNIEIVDETPNTIPDSRSTSRIKTNKLFAPSHLNELADGSIETELRVVDDISDLLTYTADTATAAAESRRYLTVVSDLSAAISSARNILEMLNIVLDYITYTLQAADECGIQTNYERDMYQSKLGNVPIFSNTLAQQVIKQREIVLWKRHSEVVTPSLQLAYCAIYAPLMWQDEGYGVIYINNLYKANAFTHSDLRLVSVISHQVSLAIRNQTLQDMLRQEELLRSNLLRQFSPRIAEYFLQNRNALSLGGQYVEQVTILVTDVRGFTALSMSMPPQKIMHHLNEMFAYLVPIIFEHDGTIDKYVGDSILAVFGSPQPDTDQCEKAVRAALAMQQAMHANASLFEIGISIHTGPVMHGFIGSDDRMEYTIVGDSVNWANRLCDAARKGEVAISQTVYEHVKDQVVIIDRRQMPSKHPETEPDLDAFIIKALD